MRDDLVIDTTRIYKNLAIAFLLTIGLVIAQLFSGNQVDPYLLALQLIIGNLVLIYGSLIIKKVIKHEQQEQVKARKVNLVSNSITKKSITKKITISILFLLVAEISLAHQSPPWPTLTREEYLKKSQSQRGTGLLLAIVGGGVLFGTLIRTAGNSLGENKAPSFPIIPSLNKLRYVLNMYLLSQYR
jgi:uncharacterized membrane protein